jgi:uncharacterized protein
MLENHGLKPTLYTVPSSESNAPPQLHGGRCRCGYVFFPFQDYGCEMCGGGISELTPTLLPAKGKLVASARVLVHGRKDRQAPFVVVAVQLDDGPVVRTLLATDRDEPLLVGAPMHAKLVEVGRSDSGAATVDLRFEPSI